LYSREQPVIHIRINNNTTGLIGDFICFHIGYDNTDIAF